MFPEYGNQGCGDVMILAWALMGHMVADHHTIRD